jgi:hypothetical protein
MSSLWDGVFIQVLDHTGPPMLNLSGTPDIIPGADPSDVDPLPTRKGFAGQGSPILPPNHCRRCCDLGMEAASD